MSLDFKKIILLGFTLYSLPVYSEFSSKIDLKDQTGWKLNRKEDGIEIYSKKIPDSSILAVRGKAKLPYPLEKIFYALLDHSRSKEWVDKLVDSRQLRIIDPLTRIIYNEMAIPWPFKNRDFVIKQKILISKNRKIVTILGNSVEDSLSPNTKLIHGEVSGIAELQWLSPTSTQASIELHGDPKGAIPAFIVNWVQKEWPYDSLIALKSKLNKDESLEHENLKKYLKSRIHTLEVFPLENLKPIRKISSNK